MRRKNGFTLIELLVIIAMISILSTVVLASLQSARSKGRDAQRISQFKQFQTALELYYDKYGVYPCGDANKFPDGTLDSSLSTPFLDGELPANPLANCIGVQRKGIYTAGFYNEVYPKDPLNNVSAGYLYAYDVSADRQSYILYTKLENDLRRMANDDGWCKNIYEVGNATGITFPGLLDLFYPPTATCVY